MKRISPLVALGISQDEMTLYELLLKNPSLSPTEIASKIDVHRPAIYKALESLLEKDLIQRVPVGKRIKYAANSPKQLQELSREYYSHIQDEIIRLEDIPRPTGPVPKITTRYGKQGIRSLYEELVSELKKGDVYYRYHSIDTDSWVSGAYITDRARKIRDVKELERFVITNEANKKRKASRPTRYMKVLPKKHDLFKHNVGQVMYGNTTVIIDYNTEIATVIESETITQFQIALFKTLFHYL